MVESGIKIRLAGMTVFSLFQRMILRKSLFAAMVLFLVQSLSANMRAPTHIEHSSGELRAEPEKTARLEVLGETLEFRCPESYKGKIDFKAFAERVCQASVMYRIRSDAPATVKLAFIFSGKSNITWKIGGKTFVSTPVILRKGEKRYCNFCPDDFNNVQQSEQVISFAAGMNELQVTYAQPLSYDESNYGYFSDGKWWQGFSYELWPIAEWQWAGDLKAELKFSIGARSGFIGIGYKDDKMKCWIAENGKQTDIALTVAKPSEDRRIATATVSLGKRPQRLHCSYTAD